MTHDPIRPLALALLACERLEALVSALAARLDGAEREEAERRRAEAVQLVCEARAKGDA